MKNKIVTTCIGTLLAAALAGCAPVGNMDVQASYIGDEAAKAIALATAQVGAADATSSAKLVQQNDMVYYEVDVAANGADYHYAIDAMTGAVIESDGSTPNPTQPSVTGSGAATPAQDATPASASTLATVPQTTAAGAVDENEAKQIALADAGVKESDAAYLRVTRDIEDGISVFDVEFFVAASSTEYDYEIDAASGAIRSKDFDAEGYTPPKQNITNASKSEQEIRKIALANVPGATDRDIRMSLDSDDGRLVYDGKIIYQNMEYEFEIDAYSGDIREWSAESLFD